MVVGDVATAVDVLLLGAGPAGYVAAIRAAQLGRRVTLVDSNPPGGTCLHRGCIPLKALLAASERYHQTRTGLDSMGISAGPVSFDWGQMNTWKQGIVGKLSKGVEQLLSGHQIEIVHGNGWFINDHEMRVEGEYGSHRFIFERCLLATGAEAQPLAELSFDGKRVLTPEQALALAEFPTALSIIGNDYIALELATLFARLGAAVTLLLPGETLLEDVDPAALKPVQTGLKALGVQIASGARPVGIQDDSLRYTAGRKAEEASAPLPVVVSLGARPRIAGLHLEAAKVQISSNGSLIANTSGRTSNEKVYASGDCLYSAPALASVAIRQAKVAVEAMNGARVQYAPVVTPLVALTAPELASAGLSPQAAEAAGYRVLAGRFPLAANGRALTLGSNHGLALVTADADSEAVLGVTLVGPHAADLIAQATLAVEMGATLTDLTDILYAHPSLSEITLEGAEAALGRAIHALTPTAKVR